MSKLIFGWITPKKEFYETGQWHHLDLDSLHPEISSLEGVSDLLDDVEEANEMCQELAECDGDTHAEWHTAAMAEDSARSAIYALMEKAGFIRVGEHEQAGSLHFEGLGIVLADRLQFLKQFAYKYNKLFILEKKEGK